MYDVKDLFNQRSVFGAKLEQIMESLSITKTKLCNEAHISRPTLDKLLNAEITNETNFEKHANKILDYFHLTPDTLMGNTHNAHNRIRQMKSALHISEKSISETTGISLSRLKDIEAGVEATTAELRDIALCCETSTRGILGTNYFDIPLASLADFTKGEIFENMRGFWGHIGIKTVSNNHYLWFPINSDVRKYMYDMMNQQFMVVPCMNNKILLLNMDGIDNIVLLDDACDPPSFANWDPSVSEGELPLVIFEALSDYQYMNILDESLISPMFHNILKKMVDEKQWDEDDIIEMLECITIYFKSSQTLSVIGQLELDQTLTDAIQMIWEFGELAPEDTIVYFNDTNDSEIIVNLSNISMIELPLLAVEDIICQELDELLK